MIYHNNRALSEMIICFDQTYTDCPITFPILVETSNRDKFKVKRTLFCHSGTRFSFEFDDCPSTESISTSTSFGTLNVLSEDSEIQMESHKITDWQMVKYQANNFAAFFGSNFNL